MKGIKVNRTQDWWMLSVGGIIYLGLYAGWLALGSGNVQLRFLIGGLAMLFTALLAAVMGVWTHRIEQTPSIQRAWLWIGLGLVIWAFGDLGKIGFGVFLPQGKFAGFAQKVIYLIGSVLLWIGLLIYPRQSRKRFSRFGLFLDTTLATAAGLTLVWITVLEPLFVSMNSSSSPDLFLYPIIDLIGMIVIMNIFLLSNVRELPAAYGWISLGLIAFTITDLIYISLVLSKTYQIGNWVDLGWVLGDMFFIFGALSQVRKQGKGLFPYKRLFTRFWLLFQSMLPLLMTLVLGVYTILAWQLLGTLSDLGMWVTVVLSLGLIGRQGFLAGEIELQKYANLVNSIAEPAFICDRRGVIRLINPALIEATSLSATDRLVGKSLKEILHPPEETGRILEQGLKQGWSGEFSLRRQDGNILPISLALRPLSPTGDRRLVLAGTAHDLTAQKKQQEALQAAYEQINSDRAELAQLNTNLEQKVTEKTTDLRTAYQQLEEQNRVLQELDKLKSDFVSMVSHELRAPLTNINAGIELSLGGADDIPSRTHRYLELVQSEIQRLTNFVETILDLSALDAGRLPLYLSPISLDSVCNILKQQMTHLEGGERLSWQIPDDLPFLLADERALTSVLFHLLDNAFKYAPEGRIIVLAQQQQDRIQIQVLDEGPGIAPDVLPRLYDRFYRPNSDDAQTVYGHGLGLYIAQRLLEGMNGEIAAANRAEGGACFTIWLPMVFEKGDDDEV